jgi:tetratricopeptide (TPR) repeat protein
MLVLPLTARKVHDHEPSGRLGKVSFPISCKAAVQKDFNRGVALLHSFSYSAADHVFRNIVQRDPQCAMAHWGIAMTGFHQLWEPRISAEAYPVAQQQVEVALRMGAKTDREIRFIRASACIFQSADSTPYERRELKYEEAISELATWYPHDIEVQVFYALALLSNASPSDKTHARQKHAAQMLEPIFKSIPDHPGVAHYLIHAYDNAELAPKGLPAARLYSTIAPSAPHALHMPSHIFTRLGLWENSIAANQAARVAAHRAGDVAEELHDMDYLVYAYLQLGREADAGAVLAELRAMGHVDTSDPKAAYAATAIPIRYAVERGDWHAAAEIRPAPGFPPEVTACAIWAQVLGLIRSGRQVAVNQAVDDLAKLEQQLQSSGNPYWSTQVRVMKLEVVAWAAHADSKEDEALAMLRQAADEEDSVEKLPVTPGPIIPAREQLGSMLLEQNQPDMAVREFRRALTEAPARRGSLTGVEAAEKRARGQ